MAFLGEFSESRKNFLLCGSDNRVNLYETDTQKRQRVFVEKNHLSHSYSSFAWSNGSSSSSSSKRKSGGAEIAKNDILAIGCSDGTIIIWNLLTGVVQKTLGTPNETPVPTDLALSNDSKTLFVSSHSNVAQYNLEDGQILQTLKAGKHGALKLAMNPKADVIAIARYVKIDDPAACDHHIIVHIISLSPLLTSFLYRLSQISNSVKLVETSSGRKRKLDAYLSGGVGAMCFSQCGQYLAVSASGVREILVFDIQADAGTAPLFVHAVDGVPKSLSVRSLSCPPASGKLVDVFCIYEDTGGCIVRITASKDKDEINPQKTEIECSALLAGAFTKNSRAVENGANAKDCLSYAVGKYSNPYFAEVGFGVSGGGIAPRLVLTDARDDGMSSGPAVPSSNGTGLGPPSILGPNDMGGKKRPVVSMGESDDVTVTGKKSRTESAGSEELTLEQRLESMSQSMNELEKQTALPARERGAEEFVPTSDSLVALVDQALQTGDDALLEQALSCDDADVVDATAYRLPVARVVLLLRRLMAKFEKRPSRGLLLTRWLAGIMRHHTAYLISVPDLSYQLAGLSQMLEQRLASYSRLASLGGRLDLVMAQISSKDSSSGKALLKPRAVVVEE